MLQSISTVPLAVAGVVQAEHGSVGVALPETLDRLTLVLSVPGATAQLDAAAVAALRDLLADAFARMRHG
jgi:hypothetical protein